MSLRRGQKMSRREELQQLEKESRGRLRERRKKKLAEESLEHKKQLEARLAAQAEERDRRLKSEAKLAFIRSGGKPKDFEKKWPKIREQLIQEETIKGVQSQPRVIRSL
jgi:hypothetical protein